MSQEIDGVQIEVRGLVKRYGAVEAVRGIDFRVRRGTVFGLLGPNGAGKTSVLECLLGLRRPDAGTLWIGGVDMGKEPETAKRRIGAVLQGTQLPGRITPREALELFGAFYPAATATEENLRRFRLTDKADAAFETLSGGQRQRLALALACVHEPEVLCLDEPTVGLDVQARRELHDLIRGWRDGGRTVLLTTHYPEEVHALCDEVAVLRGGRIVAQGPPGTLVTRRRVWPVLVVRAREPVDPEALRQRPEIQTVEQTGDEVRLSVAEVGAGVVALVGVLQAQGNELVDLRVVQPSLEDTLIELANEEGMVSA